MDTFYFTCWQEFYPLNSKPCNFTWETIWLFLKVCKTKHHSKTQEYDVLEGDIDPVFQLLHSAMISCPLKELSLLAPRHFPISYSICQLVERSPILLFVFLSTRNKSELFSENSPIMKILVQVLLIWDDSDLGQKQPYESRFLSLFLFSCVFLTVSFSCVFLSVSF